MAQSSKPKQPFIVSEPFGKSTASQAGGNPAVNRGDQVTYPDVSSITGAALSEIHPDDRPRALKGAQILARCLQLEGVHIQFEL